MNRTLVVLIVIVAVVLIVIFLASPTCKNAVSAIFKGKSKAQAPAVQPRVQVPARRVVSKPKQENLPPLVPIQQPKPEKVRVLSGTVENLFNPEEDVETKFGVSAGQLDEMVEGYKRRHMRTEKPRVPRNRALRRKELERAEMSIRNSFANLAARSNLRVDGEEMTISAMREQILSAEARKPTLRKAQRPKQFVFRK